MKIDEQKLKALIADYKNQHYQLCSRPKRTQEFNHKEQIARLEGQIFALSMIGSLAVEEINIIEQ
jgi:hypothetical protein